MVDWGIAMIVRLFAAGVVVLCLHGAVAASSEMGEGSAIASPADVTGAAIPSGAIATRGVPDHHFKLVGTYTPDGVFRKATYGAEYLERWSAERLRGTRPAEVPPSFELTSSETVVQDFVPPWRAAKSFKSRSVVARLRDTIVRAAYGPERVLRAPTHVTMDSRQRLILTDPREPSIHVLDGENSFRIQGGPKSRIWRPAGVAVDSDDNIYVADEQRAVILVYDSDGRFIRQLGRFHGENMFQQPTGIAIDRVRGRLYVLDSPLNELVAMDLNGRLIKRIGGFRDPSVEFDYPTEVAVEDNTIVVLDTFGTRIVVLDAEGTSVRDFKVANVPRTPKVSEIGLALDAAGHVYVSGGNSTGVRIYTTAGKQVGSVGDSTSEQMMFSGVSGVWVASDRMYVADTDHSRVQVFAIATSE